MEGYADAFQTLDRAVDFDDKSAILMMMLAESLSKSTQDTDLGLGFSKYGVYV